MISKEEEKALGRVVRDVELTRDGKERARRANPNDSRLGQLYRKEFNIPIGPTHLTSSFASTPLTPFNDARSEGFADSMVEQGIVSEQGWRDAMDWYLKTVSHLPPGERRPVIRDKVKELRQHLNAINHRKGATANALILMQEKQEAWERLLAWGKLELHLERNDSTRLHQLINNMVNGIEPIRRSNSRPVTPDDREWPELIARAEPFVVQHDWARAFDSANLEAGEVHLPFELCAFEFRISGANITAFIEDTGHLQMVVAMTHDFQYILEPALEFNGVGWSMPSTLRMAYYSEPSPLVELIDKLSDFVSRHVRAILIALDAQVATHSPVREPTKLNAKRAQQGRPPIKQYHVVNLSRRQTTNRIEPTGTHRSPRLHFRRGHWRHYHDHRTWIEWMLVGDPDLGFIDKHYRL